MRKFTIIEQGKSPKLLQFNFMSNARTKTKTSMTLQMDTTMNEKTYYTDIPTISVFTDNMITNVTDGIATKVFNYYDINVEQMPGVPQKEMDKFKELINPILKLSGSRKINRNGKVLEVLNNSNDLKDKDVAINAALNSLNNSNYVSIFPAEPVGIGAIWTIHDSSIPFFDKLNVSSTMMIQFVDRIGASIQLDFLIKMHAYPDQLTTGSNEKSRYIKCSGDTHTDLLMDMCTSECETKSSGVMELISEDPTTPDSEIKTIQRLGIASEYVY